MFEAEELIGRHASRGVLAEYLTAPLLNEREAYLDHLCAIGVGRRRLSASASMLLHVIRLLKLDGTRTVEPAEVNAAADAWCAEADASTSNRPPHSKKPFFWHANGFLRHASLLVLPEPKTNQFSDLLDAYVNVLCADRQLSKYTIFTARGNVTRFLDWLAPAHLSLATVTVQTVDEFIALKRKTCALSTVASITQNIRAFFAEAERLGWCSGEVKRGMRLPRLPTMSPRVHLLTWDEVRVLLKTRTSSQRHDFRANAILHLCAVYGLRGGEISRLKLAHFDWQRGQFSVARGKRGRIQHFPLHPEVAGVLRIYIEHARPPCSESTLFVTVATPYRPLSSSLVAEIVSARLAKAVPSLRKRGAHALRHACATELLRNGFSLKAIADFLGHRGLKTVSHYVQHDLAALQEVASFESGLP